VAALVPPLGGTAFGQQPDSVRQLERRLRDIDRDLRLSIPADQPIAERLLFDYGGTHRFGFYAIDDEDGNTRVLRQNDTRLYLRAELDGTHRFFGRLRFLYEDWNSGDSFDGRDDELVDPIGERYWYQFDLRGALLASRGERVPYNVNVKVGRQFVDWGSGLALSNSMYAALLDVEAFDFGLIGLAGITTGSDTVDFDGSRPGFDSDTDREYFGGSLEYRGFASHRPYVYFLAQRDNNGDELAVFAGPLLPIPTRFDYDSNYLGLGVRGSISASLRYRAEGIYEFGEGLSNSFSPFGIPVTQTEEDIDAWAGIAGLTWLLRDEADTRLDLEVIAASGDDDRLDSANTFGGNRSGTRDEAFNALGYANTGLALAPDISNLLSLRLGVSTYPLLSVRGLERLRLGVNGFIFAKLDDEAPLDIATTDDSFLGGEIDVYVDWRVASDVSAQVRYGLFLPGDAIPDGQDNPRHFIYAGLSYAF
jgi:hypothetical protein